MNTKTIEGIVGSKNNMELTNTPMRVFKEARRKGDVEAMERAMGYAGDFTQKADEYKVKAHEGTKEDVKEARQKAEAERESAIRKRKEEQEKFEKRMEESKKNADTVEISTEGKILCKENIGSDSTANDAESAEGDAAGVNGEAVRTEPVIYTKTGEVSKPKAGNGLSVSV